MTYKPGLGTGMLSVTENCEIGYTVNLLKKLEYRICVFLSSIAYIYDTYNE